MPGTTIIEKIKHPTKKTALNVRAVRSLDFLAFLMRFMGVLLIDTRDVGGSIGEKSFICVNLILIIFIYFAGLDSDKFPVDFSCFPGAGKLRLLAYGQVLRNFTLRLYLF